MAGLKNAGAFGAARSSSMLTGTRSACVRSPKFRVKISSEVLKWPAGSKFFVKCSIPFSIRCESSVVVDNMIIQGCSL